METTNHIQRVILMLTQLAVNALALIAAYFIFPGITFDNRTAAIAAPILLALVNTYLRPLIVLLTLPLNIVTLGLVTLVINAGLLMLVSWAVPAFHVDHFKTAVGAALVISIVSFLLNLFLQPGRVRLRIFRG